MESLKTALAGVWYSVVGCPVQRQQDEDVLAPSGLWGMLVLLSDCRTYITNRTMNLL